MRVCFCFINSKLWDTDDRIILTSELDLVFGDILGFLDWLTRGSESGGDDIVGVTSCAELEVGDELSMDRLDIDQVDLSVLIRRLR